MLTAMVEIRHSPSSTKQYHPMSYTPASATSPKHKTSLSYLSYVLYREEGPEVACLDGQTASVAFRNDDVRWVSDIVEDGKEGRGDR
jgi:hypothetical protein